LNRVQRFLDHFAEHCQVYFPAIEENRRRNEATFTGLAETLLEWAENYLGEGWPEVLADGYKFFLMDVNRSQIEYERRGHYLHKSYDQVYQSVYNDPQCMNRYHWGVFVSTFAWEHHIQIYEFYRDRFLPCLPAGEGGLLDLGCGSGVWSLLTTHTLPGWTAEGIDISEKSIELSSRMAQACGMNGRIRFSVGDALTYRSPSPLNAGISCFLMEHLEAPDRLLHTLAANLSPRGHAFVTAALTAAEVDHISEFRRESEVVRMAEDAGFRVVALFSAAPPSHPESHRFLPRSLALVLQKRKNEIW